MTEVAHILITAIGERESDKMLQFMFRLISTAVIRKESKAEEVVQTKDGRSEVL